MSATIYYKQVIIEKNKYLKQVNGPSNFIETCKKVFGSFPVIFSENHLNKLQVLRDLYSGEENPWEEVIFLIEKLGVIELWAEF